jgi:hypothetical protein
MASPYGELTLIAQAPRWQGDIRPYVGLSGNVFLNWQGDPNAEGGIDVGVAWNLW